MREFLLTTWQFEAWRYLLVSTLLITATAIFTWTIGLQHRQHLQRLLDEAHTREYATRTTTKGTDHGDD